MRLCCHVCKIRLSDDGGLCRDAEVLSLFAIIINRMKGSMTDKVPLIFGAVFECTLNMITVNFEDHPDHRLKFFSLLHAITNNCFHCLLDMSAQQQKLLIDSIVWAFRHTERNVAETGLSLLTDMLQRFIEQQVCSRSFVAFAFVYACMCW